MRPTPLAEFGRIDQTANPNYFIQFLDAACAEASFQTYKRRMMELLDLRPGVQILDVGCGTGDDAREMARCLDGRGRILAIDNSEAMLTEARRRAEGSGLSVEFQLADATALPFDTESLDGCRIDRSLMHVPDARQVLAEMIRVTRPSGMVVVYEVDFETLTVDADDRPLARKVVNTWCDSVRNGWLGRHVPALLRGLGLKELIVEPYTLTLTPELAIPLLGTTTVQRAVERGAITASEGQTWLEHLDALRREGRFFSTLTGFLVAGRKLARSGVQDVV